MIPNRFVEDEAAIAGGTRTGRTPHQVESMALLRQIAQLGHPVLRTLAESVRLPASDAVRTLIADMLATLEDANGVGIAAPQVYEPAALFIVASRPNPRYPDAPLMEPEVVINPEILEQSDEVVKDWEGCLSIPGIRGLVPRHRRIRARYQTIEGRMVERDFVDFVARIFQHEDDHLRGIVFLDRLESIRDVVTEKEYQKQFARPTPVEEVRKA
jgi:peptide deformylase